MVKLEMDLERRAPFAADKQQVAPTKAHLYRTAPAQSNKIAALALPLPACKQINLKLVASKSCSLMELKLKELPTKESLSWAQLQTFPVDPSLNVLTFPLS